MWCVIVSSDNILLHRIKKIIIKSSVKIQQCACECVCAPERALLALSRLMYLCVCVRMYVCRHVYACACVCVGGYLGVYMICRAC